jgi:hypothetical protein
MIVPNRYVPRSIQNIFDRVEAYNESITKELFSEELPKTFEVVIYDTKAPETKSKGGEAPADNSTSVSNYYFYKARSLKGHHDMLLRPETASSIDEYERLRNQHFQAIIKKKSDMELPQTGDVWLATSAGGNLVTLVSLQRKGNPQDFYIIGKSKAGSKAHKSGENPTGTVADYSSTSVPTPESRSSTELEFVKKIKNSPSFSGWSAQALAGVIANAQAESNYKNLAAGDSVKFYEDGHAAGTISVKRINNVRVRNVNGKCSWGYWQLNICPDDGAGKQLVDEQGIDITTESGKKEWIKKLQDDEFQFSFVAKQIASVLDTSIADEYQAGYTITTEFEKPADKANKGVKRGNSAKRIYKKYKDLLEK